MTTRIAQISDTHLSPSKPYFLSNFDIVAEHLRRERPDLIINTGDLALDGADHDADLIEAVSAHKNIGIEHHLLPGNHDVGDHPDVAKRQPANEQRLKRYRENVGADFWSLNIPGWTLLGINALILGTELSKEMEQQELIRKAVLDLNGRSLALFLHKPIADERYDEELTSNRFLTSGPRETLLSCFGATEPSVVLCGHVHQYRDSRMSDSRHLWAPATSFMISDPWQPGYGAKAVGYLMHEFESDGTHRHQLVGVRGIVHHDLAEFPEAYGDVRAWGIGGA